jgi:hypothetical protein
MVEANQYLFDFKEVVEALLKKADIHEGVWGIYVEFGLKATNAGPTESQLFPTAVVPVQRIGIQKFEKQNNLTVDAAKVNPRTKPPSRSKRK